jgi:hypothetical protein
MPADCSEAVFVNGSKLGVDAWMNTLEVVLQIGPLDVLLHGIELCKLGVDRGFVHTKSRVSIANLPALNSRLRLILADLSKIVFFQSLGTTLTAYTNDFANPTI